MLDAATADADIETGIDEGTADPSAIAPAQDTAAATKESGASDAKGGNRWDALTTAIGEGKLEDLGKESEEAEKKATADKKAEDGKPPEGKSDADPNKADPNAKPAEKPAGRRNYSIVAADGKPADVAWPEGAKMVFKGDKRSIEVKSMDELVALGQKGAAFDRVSTNVGQLHSRVGTLESKLDDAEMSLLRAVFDDDAREKLQEALKDFQKQLDPDTRAAFKASEKLSAREAADRQTAEASTTEIMENLWDQARTHATTSLEGYDYLDDSDLDDVIADFHKGYEQEWHRAFKELGAAAKQRGMTVSEGELKAAAEIRALGKLTEEELKVVMDRHEARYAKRLAGKKPADDDDADDDEEDLDEDEARAAVEKHNKGTERKQRQKAEGRSLRGGGGSPPAPRGKGPDMSKPRTYAERQEEMRRELHKA